MVNKIKVKAKYKNNSVIHHFSVFLHVSAQDSLQWTQQTLESISVDPNESAWSCGFNTGLSDSVFHQSNFTKVLSRLVFKHFLNWPHTLFLLSDTLTFSNDVKLITRLTLSHNILIRPEAFLS